MKVLVTGAAGFIGFYLAKSLLKKGYSVIGIDNVNNYYDVNLKYARLKELGIAREQAERLNIKVISATYTNFSFIRMSIEDRRELPLLFEKENFDIVCNLAAQAGVRYSLENPEAYIDSNVVGFLNILECCRHSKIKHLLYASSSSIYGESTKEKFSIIDRVDNPISLYAATKKSNELMAYTYSYLYDIPTTGLRFFTVYGPWGRPDMAMFLFTKAIIEGDHIKVFNNGDLSRDFTYIDDIIKGIDILLDNLPTDKIPYRVVNIGNGSPQPLMKFIYSIETSLGIQSKKQFLDMQPGDVPRTSADISYLEELGYQSSTDIEMGVSKFIDWYKKFYSI